MSGIQVAQGQERFIKPIGDYTENQTTNKVEYVTGQNVGGKKRAMDTVNYGTFPVSTANVIAAGSTTRVLKKVAHGARENDIIQFTSGNNSGIAIQILSCPDADTMIIAATPEFTSSVGDTFDIKRYVSPQYDSNGSLSVTATMGPIQYNVDGVATEVNRDTAIPANTRPLPVEIMGVNGTVINLTAGDINVQLSDAGASFDRTRIGDGTNQLGVNASSEALVHDAGILAELMLKADLTDTQPVSIAGTVAVSGPLTDAQLRATAVPVSAGTNLNTSALSLEATQLLVKAKTDNLDVALSTVAKDATLLASNVLIGAVAEAAPATDTASSGLNGRLQRIAQNISAMIIQLPATLGIKTAANSLSVAPASDAIFNTKPKAITGSYAEDLALSTVVTFTAPANAIGAIVQADDANTANFRAKQGAAATATSGIQFSAGRSEEFKSGSDISVCSEGAAVKVYVQWFVQV